MIDDPVKMAVSVVPLGVSERRDSIGPPRASSLYDACMRMHVLGVKLNRSRKEVVGLSGRIIFGYGNAVHYWIQNSPDFFGDNRIGWWRCSACGKVRYFGKPPKKPCKSCGASVQATIYHEHRILINDPWQISGHPDLFLLKDGVLRVVELKTMNGSEFAGLVVPKIEHQWQIQAYMSGCGGTLPKTAPEFDNSKGYVVYISKLVRPGEFPIKFFTVHRDEALLSRVREKVGLYEKGIKEGKLPPMLPACQRNPQGYKTRNCPVARDCLGRS